MKNIIIFDDPAMHMNLLPITYTRPVSYIRVGITTIYEKWQYFIPDAGFSTLVDPYLMKKFPTTITDENYFIAGHIYPCDALIEAIFRLDKGEALISPSEQLIAFHGTMEDFDKKRFSASVKYGEEPKQLHWLYDIFLHNDEQLNLDFRRLTAGRKSQSLSPTNRLIGDHEFDDGTSRYFIEEGATIEGAIINVTNGPIYIGRDATIMEGSCIRAPFAACEHSQVNMGAKIYGATTLGPYCKVGGELNNVVMMGYSNKAHDGFLGNAVIGEWCNLGGGTTASNLKNDYTEIKLWNYPAHRFLKTGLQFCGLIMGDHSKAGINCMFNTATVIGVGVNIHGAGFPRNFVASFSEGSTAGFTDVPMTKFFETAKRVMARRHVELSDIDKDIFLAIQSIAESYK
ncbi:MAG TPA: glucose-1-phosphate thymidylyltransferase [Candidatus Avimuribaculum pullicola]|nr:glucose-1-phosphate thymidylyltransferase [Candidatus Avimuribaculum pullicola]